MSIQQRLKRDSDAAFGRTPADTVIKGATVLNVATGSLRVSDIAINGENIVGVYENYDGRNVIDGSGLFAVPGFFNTHLHVESSLLTPYEYERLVLPCGTTTAICDPHEMANVIGCQAFDYFLKAASGMVMDLRVQLSSCVPATNLETSGATILAADLAPYVGAKHGLGLAEFMNLGGIATADPDVLDKLALFADGMIDGHLPGIRGAFLNVVGAMGIRNDHESTSYDEALEKLEKGLHVFIRGGSVCRDDRALWPLLTTQNAPRLSLCTDDRKPHDIHREGDIDFIIRECIRAGADMRATYRAATLSAAEHYGLRDRGLIAAGRRADIVLLSDLDTCKIESVMKNGRIVNDALFQARPELHHVGYNSVKIRNLTAADLRIDGSAKNRDVIGLIEGQIISKALKADLPLGAGGGVTADPAQDILKLAVIERHGKGQKTGLGFLKGLQLTGALASTVAHDHHNMIVAGSNDADMILAAARLKEMQGGFVVVKDGKVLAEMPLAVAGLMTDKNAEAAIADLDRLNAAVAGACPLPVPFMYLSFMGLCVIPTLKLTDLGLTKFDPAGGDQGPAFVV